jgi:F-type H+-transporting ATPase subunit O
MSNTFKRDTQLQNILTAPTLSADDKKQIVAEIQKFTGVQDKTNTLQNFLSTLAENNRLGVLEGVCEKFATLMSAARGEVEMTITSAAPLDQKVVRQLEQAVSKSQYVGQGKKLKVVPKVSPIVYATCNLSSANVKCLQVNSDIRGGLIVEIGDRTIDLSVSAKMARMNKLLQDTL